MDPKGESFLLFPHPVYCTLGPCFYIIYMTNLWGFSQFHHHHSTLPMVRPETDTQVHSSVTCEVTLHPSAGLRAIVSHSIIHASPVHFLHFHFQRRTIKWASFLTLIPKVPIYPEFTVTSIQFKNILESTHILSWYTFVTYTQHMFK